MGTASDPTLLGTLFAFLCISPWVYLLVSAIRDKPIRKPPQQQKAPVYREIPTRDLADADERAGFVQAKLDKIERASR